MMICQIYCFLIIKLNLCHIFLDYFISLHVLTILKFLICEFSRIDLLQMIFIEICLANFTIKMAPDRRVGVLKSSPCDQIVSR